MADPLEPVGLIVVTSTVSVVVKEVLSSGLTWIRKRFADAPKATKEQVKINIEDFLIEFGGLVKRYEASNTEREEVDQVTNQPDFIVLMQRVLLSAAQTSRHDKHILLAQIVASRLQTTDEDSTLARTCELACEAVSHLTSNQLSLLALHYTLEHMPFPSQPTPLSEPLLRTIEIEWVQAILTPYSDVKCVQLDRKHLDAVGCIGAHGAFLSPGFESMLRHATSPDFAYERFIETELGAHLRDIFEKQGLNGTMLTSMGSLIGMYTADMLASRPTNVGMWRG